MGGGGGRGRSRSAEARSLLGNLKVEGYGVGGGSTLFKLRLQKMFCSKKF